MGWRVAESLDVLLAELNAAHPSRARASDGSIGDPSHASRRSDHNPWWPPPAGGVVTARDFDDDDPSGADMRRLAEHLRASRDARIKYVISEGRMFSSYPTSRCPAWEWRPYTGPNGHFQHLHLSVRGERCDDTSPWGYHLKEEDMVTDEDAARIADAVWQRMIGNADLTRPAANYVWDTHVNTQDVLDDVRATAERIRDLEARFAALAERLEPRG